MSAQINRTTPNAVNAGAVFPVPAFVNMVRECTQVFKTSSAERRQQQYYIANLPASFIQQNTGDLPDVAASSGGWLAQSRARGGLDFDSISA